MTYIFNPENFNMASVMTSRFHVRVFGIIPVKEPREVNRKEILNFKQCIW